MRLLDEIMSVFPLAEVIVRICYSDHRDSKLAKGMKAKFFRSAGKDDIEPVEGLYDKLFEHIRSLGISKGDILIVHSSMDGLIKLGVSAEKIIEGLLNLVGPEGTLVMPAFPKFKKKDILDNGKTKIYDVKKTLAWTGFINNIFLRTDGVIRSEFPYNPLAAKGKEAAAMFESNLKGEVPHGRYSAWEYCAEHHAKVLFLGVKPFHSITESHIVEDYLNDEWPIKDWYINQHYIIMGYNGKFEMTIKERDLKWAKYITEHNAAYRTRKAGYLYEEDFEGIPIGHINDLYEYNEYRISQVKKGKIDFLIPKKYWK